LITVLLLGALAAGFLVVFAFLAGGCSSSASEGLGSKKSLWREN